MANFEIPQSHLPESDKAIQLLTTSQGFTHPQSLPVMLKDERAGLLTILKPETNHLQDITLSEDGNFPEIYDTINEQVMYAMNDLGLKKTIRENYANFADNKFIATSPIVKAQAQAAHKKNLHKEVRVDSVLRGLQDETGNATNQTSAFGSNIATPTGTDLINAADNSTAYDQISDSLKSLQDSATLADNSKIVMKMDRDVWTAISINNSFKALFAYGITSPSMQLGAPITQEQFKSHFGLKDLIVTAQSHIKQKGTQAVKNFGKDIVMYVADYDAPEGGNISFAYQLGLTQYGIDGKSYVKQHPEFDSSEAYRFHYYCPWGIKVVGYNLAYLMKDVIS